MSARRIACIYSSDTRAVSESGGELKTKPTQHSVGELRKIGIQPTFDLPHECELPQEEREKIAQFCNVEFKAVIEERDKELSIYEVPVSLSDNKLDEIIVERLNLRSAKPLDLTDWKEMLERIRHPGPT